MKWNIDVYEINATRNLSKRFDFETVYLKLNLTLIWFELFSTCLRLD